MRPSSDGVVFFVDRALGSEDVPNALKGAGATVQIHADHFSAHEESDAPWIKDVTERGWVILTKDKRIRWNALEKRTLERAGAAAFIPTAGDQSGIENDAAFVDALPRIRAVLSKYTRPLLCTVSANGSVRVLLGDRRGGIRR